MRRRGRKICNLNKRASPKIEVLNIWKLLIYCAGVVVVVRVI